MPDSIRPEPCSECRSTTTGVTATLAMSLAWGFCAAGIVAIPGTGELAAQDRPSRSLDLPDRIERSLATVPFGPGERTEYDVRLGPVRVGEGVMEVVGVTPVRGRPSYHTSWVIQGGIPLARVDDHFQSWFDIETLASRRFIQDIHEVRYTSYRHFEIYPSEGYWERRETEERGDLITDVPLDQISFIYYARTLPLEVGETYEMDRYFREDRNPVTLKVLERKQIEVPAGTFDTVVVEPIIKAGGLFGEGGEAKVYFTDDERRILVKMESSIPIVGSLSLHLRSHEEGRPLQNNHTTP